MILGKHVHVKLEIFPQPAAALAVLSLLHLLEKKIGLPVS